MQYFFPKKGRGGRGGQRLFAESPKIHPFWRGQASLSLQPRKRVKKEIYISASHDMLCWTFIPGLLINVFPHYVDYIFRTSVNKNMENHLHNFILPSTNITLKLPFSRMNSMNKRQCRYRMNKYCKQLVTSPYTIHLKQHCWAPAKTSNTNRSIKHSWIHLPYAYMHIIYAYH